jgi:hypothetical protein
MSEQNPFPRGGRTLQFAPFWIFSAVIGAYDRFGPRDYQAFVRCLEAATPAEGRPGPRFAEDADEVQQGVAAAVGPGPDTAAASPRRRPARSPAP